MLADKISSAIVAVRDIARARRFYGGTLGLELAEDGTDVLVFRTGTTHLVVYLSDFAGTNRANAVVWDAGADLDAIVDDLRKEGVAFERYAMEGAEWRDGVHHVEGMKLVWFKDPDGNILHIHAMPPSAEAGTRP